MTGKKGRSGRRKSPTQQLKEKLDELKGDIPGILDSLKQIAFGEEIRCPSCGASVGILKPDREAAIYLIDRIMGKPRAEIDISGEMTLSPGRAREIAEAERKAFADYEQRQIPESVA